MAKHDHPTVAGVDLLAGSFWGRNPHDAFTEMRASAPVYWDQTSQVWAITKYGDLREISRDPQRFSSATTGIRPHGMWLPMMIDMDDPAHWGRRKLVNRGFTPKQVRAQEPKVREVVTSLLDSVCEQGECDLVTDLAAWLPLIMIGDALGFDPADRPTLLQWSDDLLRGLDSEDAGEKMARAAEAMAGYATYTAGVVADRRGCPRDDLMSILVDAEVDGDRLDDDALLHESLLILIGGDETSRHVISGGAYQLLRHPDQRQALIDDPSLIPTAVEEMLRWVSPIKNMNRTATVDVELRGQTIEAGDQVMLVYPSANRDEEVFDDPFRFDIRRDPNDHVAFGFGPHFCLGNSLARLEMVVFFEEWLRRMPDTTLVDGTEPAYRPANFVSGYETMPVQFTPSASVGV
ncbi:MAG TPA: cytochrome P450 [Acidimicrobiales bacterium]|jgi:cytochrome P450 family 142 subfamily A polypeptide 1|nr:cytochrome P450 [Acidimicrobiales bacterium]